MTISNDSIKITITIIWSIAIILYTVIAVLLTITMKNVFHRRCRGGTLGRRGNISYKKQIDYVSIVQATNETRKSKSFRRYLQFFTHPVWFNRTHAARLLLPTPVVTYCPVPSLNSCCDNAYTWIIWLNAHVTGCVCLQLYTIDKHRSTNSRSIGGTRWDLKATSLRLEDFVTPKISLRVTLLNLRNKWRGKGSSWRRSTRPRSAMWSPHLNSHSNCFHENLVFCHSFTQIFDSFSLRLEKLKSFIKALSQVQSWFMVCRGGVTYNFYYIYYPKMCLHT